MSCWISKDLKGVIIKDWGLGGWILGNVDYLKGLEGWRYAHEFSVKGPSAREDLKHPSPSPLPVRPLFPNLLKLESLGTQSRTFLFSILTLSVILSNLMALNTTYKLCPKSLSPHLQTQISTYLPDISIWMSEYLQLNTSKTSLSPNLLLLPLKLAFPISFDAYWDGYKDALSKKSDI